MLGTTLNSITGGRGIHTAEFSHYSEMPKEMEAKVIEESKEQGHHSGLGILGGSVVPFPGSEIKIPQIGWNQLEICASSNLLDGIKNGDYFYFNHGYYCIPEDSNDVLTTTNYGIRFVSSVEHGMVFGVQYHPEKSQKIGLRVLKNFVELSDA